ncbi:MAG: biotin carboxylase N-terminal domain-containing protein [Vicinamibacterales bacterium]
MAKSPVHIIQACRDTGLASVAVFSECDRAALHVRLADEAYPVGPNAPRESYLRIDRLVDAARRAGADAVHPGYGFLAENEDFAAACRDTGLTFIGPSPGRSRSHGQPRPPRAGGHSRGRPDGAGTEGLGDSIPDDEVRRIAEGIGYPLMLKAVAGGGGKGMPRMVASPEDLAGALRAARSEAGSAFRGLRLHGAPHRAAASHRGAAAGGRARDGGPVRRTGSAPSSGATRRWSRRARRSWSVPTCAVV